ncbi:MAG TPA: response regulator [Pyrinomonadaceae bacterium]|nr:response regulator [Pyrinomonadaceae bacterium]
MKRPTERRLKILDVQDDPCMRMLVKDYLEREGYEVVQASDGQQGIEAALREKPDLILMNFMMPVMDGDAATRRLREHPQMRDVPIILNTACQGEIIQELMASGFTDYIILPCDPRQITEMIQKYCPAAGRSR